MTNELLPTVADSVLDVESAIIDLAAAVKAGGGFVTDAQTSELRRLAARLETLALYPAPPNDR